MVLLKNHGRFNDQMWCHKSVEAEYRAVLQSKNVLGNNDALGGSDWKFQLLGL